MITSPQLLSICGNQLRNNLLLCSQFTDKVQEHFQCTNIQRRGTGVAKIESKRKHISASFDCSAVSCLLQMLIKNSLYLGLFSQLYSISNGSEADKSNLYPDCLSVPFFSALSYITPTWVLFIPALGLTGTSIKQSSLLIQHQFVQVDYFERKEGADELLFHSQLVWLWLRQGKWQDH